MAEIVSAAAFVIMISLTMPSLPVIVVEIIIITTILHPRYDDNVILLILLCKFF